MLVKNHSGRQINENRLMLFLGMGLLGICLLLAWKIDWQRWAVAPAIVSENLPENPESYVCDAEVLVNEEGNIFFQGKEQLFGNGLQQSSEYAHSGSFSCKVNEDYPYGFTFDIADGFEVGDRFEISVWRYRSENLKVAQGGSLVASFLDQGIYLNQEKPQNMQENGWEKLLLRLVVPAAYRSGPLRIYVYHTHEEPVWYDDLLIEKLPNENTAFARAAEDTAFQVVDLRISEKGMNKLQEKRAEAFQKWLLVTEDDDWVKGKIGRKDDEISVKLRLKGDLLDHLAGDKWSFRVRAKAPQSWNRLMTFSLQNPATRNFLAEWVYHQFLQKEDVLCPRYDFVRLFLNGKNLGPYAYEEHFEKQLLEFRARREGPIVKFAEEGMWQARRRDLNDDLPEKSTELTLNQYEAAEIEAFRQSKTLEDPKLAKQFAQAQSLMKAYKYGEKPVTEVFDLDRLARYYAITDIFKAYHGIIWHNQRFYYNPVIGKLEPIGFDGFVFESEMNWVGRPFMLFELVEKEGDLELDLVNQLFFDQVFVERYISYLWKYSNEKELEDFFFSLEKAIAQREKLIQEEVRGYKLDTEFFLRSARETHALILPMDHVLRMQQDRSGKLEVANTHALPIRLIGHGKSEKLPEYFFPKKENWLRPHSPQSPLAFHPFSNTEESKYLFYEVPGIDSLFHCLISRNPAITADTPPQRLFAQLNIQSNDVYKVEEKQVIFPAGKYQIAEDIVIPAGYQVKFEAGVSLDMVRGAAFISRSPVQMYGDAEAPIHIFSSDKSAHGFTVLQAEGSSSMSHVSFEGLNTLLKEGWELTGAVTFFESDVNIHQCAFRENVCEDALNLIRCEFELNESLIANTFADGFDADFCRGKVGRCKFVKTGNDGMDFSGSVILIKDCEVISPGDKGISVGEEATVQVISVTITDAKLGVASKDLSRLSIDFIRLTDCKTGFAAYQKKPEYGPARIEVKAYEAKGVKRLHLIEKGSVLMLDGRVAEGI